MSHGYMLLVSSQPVVLWLSGGGLTRSSMYHYPNKCPARATISVFAPTPLSFWHELAGAPSGARGCVNSGEAAAGHVPEE